MDISQRRLTKLWQLFKVNAEDKAKHIFGGNGVQITTDGNHHLKASMGPDKYEDENLDFKVDQWVKELGILWGTA